MNERRQVEQKLDLFFPYYVDQSRLLDIYAILNGGYSEFSEITNSTSTEKSRSGSAEGKISGGFKVLDIGGGLSGEIGRIEGQETGSREKKVQTVTSILSQVLSALKEKNYLHEIDDAVVGSFVFFPAIFRINSIKSLLSEITELMRLISGMQSTSKDGKFDNTNVNEMNKVIKSIQIMFAGEEIFFETNNYAIVGNIHDDNLYQAVREDLIGTELKCLAKVKRIFPSGTQLMRNTIFKKFKDPKTKREFIEAIQEFLNSDVYEFEATAITEIVGKPVYQIEIIALFQ